MKNKVILLFSQVRSVIRVYALIKLSFKERQRLFNLSFDTVNPKHHDQALIREFQI